MELYKENCLVKLNMDIEIIVKTIRKFSNSNIVSIILYGSYGRGEGAFYEEGDNIFTYNDYDLIIIVDASLSKTLINSIKEKLKRKLSIRWIDLTQKTISELKKLKPSIFNFDLKYGSKVIWGNKRIFEYIPDFKAEQIPEKDIEILYFTRLYTFLGSLKLDAFENGIYNEDARFFRNQMAKAILAVADILLIQKKMYHSSYIERTKRILQYYSEKIEFVELCEWALNEKLNPKGLAMTSDEINLFYKKILTIYLKEFNRALSKFYKKQITSTFDIEKALLFSLEEFISRIKTTIKTRSLSRYNKHLNIKLAQSFIAESFIYDDEKKQIFLNRGLKLIKQINPKMETNKTDWNNLRLIIANIRSNA